MPHRSWVNRGVPDGGLMELPAHLADSGVPPRWVMCVSTPDADACARKAKSLGGTVLEMVDGEDGRRLNARNDAAATAVLAVSLAMRNGQVWERGNGAGTRS